MPPKTLLGYTRRSVIEADRNTHSPERQRASMNEWAAAHGYQIEHYQDLGISGKKEANRPGWQSLIARLDDPDVAGVITESLDRLHRNVARSSDFRERLEGQGKEIIFTNMPGVDASSAAGKMFLNIHAVVDQYWTDITSEKMRASVHHVRMVNQRHWGKCPFGSDRDPETLHLIPSTRFYYYNPATDETRARPITADEPPAPPPGFETRYFYDSLTALYQLYATAQYSYGDVAQILNLSGWRIWIKDCNTPRLWTFKDIEIVTRRAETYAGKFNRSAAGPLPAGHKPILPIELCEAVVAARQIRSTVRSPGNKGRPAYTYLLSGILSCGTCGSGLGGQKAAAGYYYRHTYYKNGCPEKSPKVHPLESRVIELLLGIVKRDLLSEVKAELKAILEMARTAGSEGESVAAKLLDKEAELDRLIGLHIKGRISFERFDRMERELQEEIAGLKRQTAIAPGVAADVDRLAKEVVNNIDRLSEAGREQQKIIIRSMIERIQISNQAISSIKPTVWARPFFEFCGHFPSRQLVVQ